MQNIKLYDEEELSEDEVYDRYIRHNIKVANFAKTSQHYLLEKKGYTKGTILHRSTCNNTDYGYGIFTGEFEDSEEGVLLKFTDGFYKTPGKYISREVYDVRPIDNGVIIHYKGVFETRDNVAITVTFELSNGEYKIKKIRFY